MSQARAILEAEDPKSVFRQMVKVPDPPAALLAGAVTAVERKLGKKKCWTRVHTNLHRQTFCFGEFGSKQDNVVITLLRFDRLNRQWIRFLIPAKNIGEAEDPKSVFRKITHVSDEDVRKLLQDAGFKQYPTTLLTGHERWYLPAGRAVPNRDVEVLRYQDEGGHVWRILYYSPSTGRPSFASGPQTAAHMAIFLKQLFDLGPGSVAEAEDPKMALRKALAWKETEHWTGKDRVWRRTWLVEQWDFKRRDGWRLVLRKMVKDPEKPQTWFWRWLLGKPGHSLEFQAGTDEPFNYEKAFACAMRFMAAIQQDRYPSQDEIEGLKISEAEDPKRFLQRMSRDPRERLRKVLRDTSFVREEASERFERWVRHLDEQRAGSAQHFRVEVTGFLYHNQFVWDHSFYLQTESGVSVPIPNRETGTRSAQYMAAFLKRMYG
jgi:hypothetical protein